MNNNLERHGVILNEISKHFTIKSKEFSQWWNNENDSCYFYLSETPKWKYAIRLEEADNEFVIFGEHEELIDKFKPSCTYLDYENEIERFIEEVKKIAENPKLYFVDSMTYGEALEPWVEHKCGAGDITYAGYQVIREYNKETKLWDKFRRDESITQEDFVNKEYEEYQNKKLQEIKEIEHDRQYAFSFFKELINISDEIVAVGIVDKNKGGWRCSPRYDIKVVVNKNISDEKLDKLYDDLEELIYNKNCLDEVKTSEHRFSIDDCYDNLDDIKNCDYKYYKEGVKL